jgi:hypothetical protein
VAVGTAVGVGVGAGVAVAVGVGAVAVEPHAARPTAAIAVPMMVVSFMSAAAPPLHRPSSWPVQDPSCTPSRTHDGCHTHSTGTRHRRLHPRKCVESPPSGDRSCSAVVWASAPVVPRRLWVHPGAHTLDAYLFPPFGTRRSCSRPCSRQSCRAAHAPAGVSRRPVLRACMLSSTPCVSRIRWTELFVEAYISARRRARTTLATGTLRAPWLLRPHPNSLMTTSTSSRSIYNAATCSMPTVSSLKAAGPTSVGSRCAEGSSLYRSLSRAAMRQKRGPRR